MDLHDSEPMFLCCQCPSHTGLSIILYIDSTEEVVSLVEVELQKPRNLSVHESEECEHGEGVVTWDRHIYYYYYEQIKRKIGWFIFS